MEIACCIQKVSRWYKAAAERDFLKRHKWEMFVKKKSSLYIITRGKLALIWKSTFHPPHTVYQHARGWAEWSVCYSYIYCIVVLSFHFFSAFLHHCDSRPQATHECHHVCEAPTLIQVTNEQITNQSVKYRRLTWSVLVSVGDSVIDKITI